MQNNNTSKKVLAVYKSGKIVKFSSIVAASKVLSGNGSTRLTRTIGRRLSEGGGYVSSTDVWIQADAMQH